MQLRQVVCVGVKRWASLAPMLNGAWSGQLVGAAAPDVPASLKAGAQEGDDSRRPACYDRDMARLGAAPAAAAAAAPVAPASAPSPDKSFGLSPEQLRKLEPRDSRQSGALGSFHLYAPGGVATRVTRAR